jgi:hypothetical protein
VEGTWTSLNPAVGNLYAVFCNVFNELSNFKYFKIKNTCNQTGLARLIAACNISAIKEFMQMKRNKAFSSESYCCHF